jgi:hypothetical protein
LSKAPPSSDVVEALANRVPISLDHDGLTISVAIKMFHLLSEESSGAVRAKAFQDGSARWGSYPSATFLHSDDQVAARLATLDTAQQALLGALRVMGRAESMEDAAEALLRGKRLVFDHAGLQVTIASAADNFYLR